ncbi:hypothetical protein CPB86DRAFT_801849, partial [Serendipita vermifera]
IVPVAAIATVGTGATYLWQSKSWKDKSMFNNPRYHGFPIGPLRPLMPIERVREEDRANKDQAMFFSRAIGRIPIVKAQELPFLRFCTERHEVMQIDMWGAKNGLKVFILHYSGQLQGQLQVKLDSIPSLTHRVDYH